MSLLESLLGIGGAARGAAAGVGETASVRRIAAALARLPAERARYLAAFAYVLARVAHADLRVVEEESRLMQEAVREHGGLDESEAALVTELAIDQGHLLGGTENYLVTRELRGIATRAERLAVLEAAFAIAAADGSIAESESQEALAIGEELGFAREEALAVRSRFRDRLASLARR